MPTEIDWAPSVRIITVLFDGQRSRAVTRSCYLRPRQKFLTLNVSTDKSEYEPGEECVAVVTATDSQGNVVPQAEISLGVVDEAIYDLQRDPTPDLQKYFFEYELPYLCRGHYDTTAPATDTLWYWRGPRYGWGYLPHTEWLRGRSAMSRYGAGMYACGSAARRGTPTRRDFRSTAHWVADLVTDQRGQARTTFRLPDNMTDWRMGYWTRIDNQNSMGVPVELRCPFLDHRLVEFAFQLPVEYLIRDGWLKWVLRRAMRDHLPAEIVWRRRKMGFPFPLRTWLLRRKPLLLSALGSLDCPFVDGRKLEAHYDEMLQRSPAGAAR